MSAKDEDFICFYRDAVIAGHDDPAAETMRRFSLSRDYTVRLLNEAIARCDGLDIRNWNRRIRSPERSNSGATGNGGYSAGPRGWRNPKHSWFYDNLVVASRRP